MKSNLKTTKEDFENAAKNKKEVRFGTRTTYGVKREEDDSDFYDQDADGDGKTSPRRSKNVIEEVDIGDGVEDKERAKAQLER